MSNEKYSAAASFAPAAFIKVLRRFFEKGDARVARIKINVAIGGILKGISYLISFAMVPLLLQGLGPVNYGVWLTIGSVTSWIEIFDFGLGNGLMNKFAEARALQQNRLAREYVSTAYVTVAAMVTVLAVSFYGAGYFTDWSTLFNAHSVAPDSMRATVFLVFGFVFAHFLFNLVVNLLIADQKPAFKIFLDVTGFALSFVLLYLFLKQQKTVSLPAIGIIMGGSPVLVLVLANVFCYSAPYRIFRPSLKFVNRTHFRALTKLGLKFFVLNATTLVLHMTDSMIISHIASPAEVAVYGICLKYFSILTAGFILIIGPFWIAFTEAYAKKDMQWIEKNMKRNMKIWGGFAVLTGLFLFGSEFFYSVWIKDRISIPFRLSLMMAITVVLMQWKIIFVNFLNGIGKLNLQLYLGSFVMIVNIPLSIFLGKTLHMGSVGVLSATALCLLLYAVLLPLQYRKIISNTAKGFWRG